MARYNTNHNGPAPLRRYQDGVNVGNVRQTYTAYDGTTEPFEPDLYVPPNPLNDALPGNVVERVAIWVGDAVASVRDFVDRCVEICRMVVQIFVFIVTLPIRVARELRNVIGGKLAAAVYIVGVLLLLCMASKMRQGASFSQALPVISRTVRCGNERLSRLSSEGSSSHLLIRSWPASHVKIDGEIVEAPARKSVKLQAGKQSFYFVPTDQSIKPLKVTVDLLRDRSMELRVNLESKKYNLIDKGCM